MDEATQQTLDGMGETRIRLALQNGTLVSHLMVPAYEWLDALTKAKTAAKIAPKAEEPHAA